MRGSLLVAALSLSGILVGTARADVTVTGKSGAHHQWTIPGAESKDFVKGTKVGDPANRMPVPVANGDIVSFVVTSGTHRVVFENAKSEQGTVWEVVKDSGKLRELKSEELPHFNHDEARCSEAGGGNLIKIKILKLDKGKNILFACTPHSETKTDVEMVGTLVGK